MRAPKRSAHKGQAGPRTVSSELRAGGTYQESNGTTLSPTIDSSSARKVDAFKIPFPGAKPRDEFVRIQCLEVFVRFEFAHLSLRISPLPSQCCGPRCSPSGSVPLPSFAAAHPLLAAATCTPRATIQRGVAGRSTNPTSSPRCGVETRERRVNFRIARKPPKALP